MSVSGWNVQVRPSSISICQVVAYVLPYNEIRVTFDTELSAAKPSLNIFSDSLYSIPLPEYYSFIIEVKYNNFLPTHIKTLLEHYNLTRLSVSKFLLCRNIIQ